MYKEARCTYFIEHNELKVSTYPEIKPINSDKETLLVQGTFLQD